MSGRLATIRHLYRTLREWPGNGRLFSLIGAVKLERWAQQRARDGY